MNPKLEKLENEIEKTKTKIAEMQAKLHKLEEQKTELENTDYVAVARSFKLTPQQLADFLKSQQAAPSETILPQEKEDVLALTLLVSVSALPVTAHAGGSKDTTPPTLTASLEGDALKIESSDDLSGVEAVFVDENRINSLTDGKASVALKDYAGAEKQVSIYAKDYAGNRSDAVKLDNPYYKEPAPEKKPAAAAPQSPSGTQTKPPKEEKPSGSNAAPPSGGGNSSGSDNSTGQQENTSTIPEGAFTPEGTGTVQDNISGTDGEKQFYTITTDAGNVFYLVIDGKREDNNVYFLNGVTESDLMALAEKNNGSMSMIPQEESCNCTEKCEVGKVNTGCPVCKNDLNGCKGKEKPAETEKPAEPEKPM